jgi:hypothetical protein
LVDTVTTTNRSVQLSNGTFYVGVTAINASGETVAEGQVFTLTVELPPNDQIIFVSSIRYFIDPTGQYPPPVDKFGSPGAADWHCTNLANNAQLLPDPWDFQRIYFRALVTEADFGLITRAGLVDQRYYNTSGDLVAADRASLLSGQHTAPILTQGGNQLTGTQAVWTGASSTGTSAPESCINWSTTSGVARAGNLNGTGSEWISLGDINCSTLARLYCVGDRLRS